MQSEAGESYLLGDQLSAKLALLGAEAFFDKHNQGNPLPPDYFATGGSPEQFATFAALVKWLFSLLELNAAGVSAYADPQALCEGVLAELRGRGWELSAEITPQRLRSGAGEAVTSLLLALVDRLLAARQLSFAAVGYPLPEELAPQPGGEEEAEEESGRSFAAEELDHALAAEEDPSRARDRVLQTEVSEQEWYAECDRVAERLQTRREGDRNEWRTHIDINRHHSSNVEGFVARLKRSLERVSETIERQNERIRVSETFLNNALASALADLQGAFERRQENDLRIKRLNAKIKELGDEHAGLNVRCADVQRKIDSQNATATNDEPVAVLRKTLEDLRAEMRKMDIHIGVLGSTILNHNFRNRRAKLDSAANRPEEDRFEFSEHQLEELT